MIIQGNLFWFFHLIDNDKVTCSIFRRILCVLCRAVVELKKSGFVYNVFVELMHFGELKKVLKPITNTALTNALKELEADELVQRIQYNEIPLRVEYSLTEKGRDLLPVFYAISQWGMKYIP